MEKQYAANPWWGGGWGAAVGGWGWGGAVITQPYSAQLDRGYIQIQTEHSYQKIIKIIKMEVIGLLAAFSAIVLFVWVLLLFLFLCVLTLSDPGRVNDTLFFVR